MAPVQDVVGEPEVADLVLIPCLAGKSQTMQICYFRHVMKGRCLQQYTRSFFRPPQGGWCLGHGKDIW